MSSYCLSDELGTGVPPASRLSARAAGVVLSNFPELWLLLSLMVGGQTEWMGRRSQKFRIGKKGRETMGTMCCCLMALQLPLKRSV